MALLMAELPFMQIAATALLSSSSFRRFIDYTAWLRAHPLSSVRPRPPPPNAKPVPK